MGLGLLKTILRQRAQAAAKVSLRLAACLFVIAAFWAQAGATNLIEVHAAENSTYAISSSCRHNFDATRCEPDVTPQAAGIGVSDSSLHQLILAAIVSSLMTSLLFFVANQLRRPRGQINFRLLYYAIGSSILVSIYSVYTLIGQNSHSPSDIHSLQWPDVFLLVWIFAGEFLKPQRRQVSSTSYLNHSKAQAWISKRMALFLAASMFLIVASKTGQKEHFALAVFACTLLISTLLPALKHQLSLRRSKYAGHNQINFGWSGLQIATVGFLLLPFASEHPHMHHFSVLLLPLGLAIDLWSYCLASQWKSTKLYEKYQSFKEDMTNYENLRYLMRAAIHDIANPLALISMTCEIEQQKTKTRSEITKIGKASQLIADILDYARIAYRSHNLQPPLTKVELKSVFDDCFLITENLIQRKQLRVRLEMENDLLVYSHESLLKSQIIANLISNAIKFSNPGGMISIEAYQHGEWCIINIHNGGQTITGDVIRAVNDSEVIKTQLGSAGEKGTGYGLAIANRATNLLKGKLLISSSDNIRGSGNSSLTERGSSTGTLISVQIPIFKSS